MPRCLWPQECKEARHELGGLGGYDGRGSAGAGREKYYTPAPHSVAWGTSQQLHPSSAPFNLRPSANGEGGGGGGGGGGHTGYLQAQSRPHQQYWMQSLLPQQQFAGEPSTKPPASRQQMLDLQNISYDGASRRTAFNASLSTHTSPLPYNAANRSSISPGSQGAGNGHSRFKVTWLTQIRACVVDHVSSSMHRLVSSHIP